MQCFDPFNCVIIVISHSANIFVIAVVFIITVMAPHHHNNQIILVTFATKKIIIGSINEYQSIKVDAYISGGKL